MIQNRKEIEEINKQKQENFIPFLEEKITIKSIKKIIAFLKELKGYKGDGMEDALKFFEK